ncbi:MAG: hypothetical protein ACRDYX_20535 [Egibacteraceae bacterium]
MGRGELDGAHAALGPVLDLPSERRIHAVVTSAQRAHGALRDPRYRGSAAAQEAQEEIEAFCQATAGALPRWPAPEEPVFSLAGDSGYDHVPPQGGGKRPGSTGRRCDD